MKSKTLTLIEGYHRILNEQTPEDMAAGAEGAPDASQVAPEAPAPEPEQEVIQLTSEGEDELISMIVDASLFTPTPSQKVILQDIQNSIYSDKFKEEIPNSRETILPILLDMLSGVNQEQSFEKQLTSLDK